jgi:hypothetical protein
MHRAMNGLSMKKTSDGAERIQTEAQAHDGSCFVDVGGSEKRETTTAADTKIVKHRPSVHGTLPLRRNDCL